MQILFVGKLREGLKKCGIFHPLVGGWVSRDPFSTLFQNCLKSLKIDLKHNLTKLFFLFWVEWGMVTSLRVGVGGCVGRRCGQHEWGCVQCKLAQVDEGWVQVGMGGCMPNAKLLKPEYPLPTPIGLMLSVG